MILILEKLRMARFLRRVPLTDRVKSRFESLFPAVSGQERGLEAAGGFEPPNNGFADRRLSHLAMPPHVLTAVGRSTPSLKMLAKSDPNCQRKVKDEKPKNLAGAKFRIISGGRPMASPVPDGGFPPVKGAEASGALLEDWPTSRPFAGT